MTSKDLENALRLFEHAEQETDPKRKLSALEEALDITDYLQGNSMLTTQEISLAANLRKSHLRRLLSQLTTMRRVQIDVWFEYIKLMFQRANSDVKAILADDSSLRESYNEFISLWAKEALDILTKQVK
ncbi:MAG: hypothetical protein K8F51_04385 [Comamonas sp.]|nr:hypothetical protein [Comamonas sp.]